MYNINGLTVILAILIYGVCLVLIICTLGLLSVFLARKDVSWQGQEENDKLQVQIVPDLVSIDHAQRTSFKWSIPNY